MEVVSNVWHVFSALLIFLLGAAYIITISSYFYLGKARSLFLYCWHTVFCIGYLLFTLSNVADAKGYFLAGEMQPDKFALGTEAINWMVFIFRMADFSYLGLFLIFNIFGAIGFVAFFAALNQAVGRSSMFLRRAVLLLVLLPSVSFWTSAIGKDSLAFLAIGLSLWAALALERRKLLMLLAIMIMLWVRPHMAGMMVLAIGFSVLVQARMSIFQRLLICGGVTAAAVVLVPFALKFVGFNSAITIESMLSYIEARQGLNRHGGGAIDIASMSLSMQLFTYLFRPLPFEAHNIAALAASLDNTIILALFSYYIGIKLLLKPVKNPLPLRGDRLFLWCYVIVAWFILASTTANLGISVRQKWMFLPYLAFLAVSYIASRQVVYRRVKFTPVNKSEK